MPRPHALPIVLAPLLLAAAACSDGGRRGSADTTSTDTTSDTTSTDTMTTSETTSPKENLCTATQGTWNAGTQSCTCGPASGWTDANGCTTCSVACADACDSDDGEACGADHNWWCECELTCEGMARAPSRLDCCDAVPSNCVPTCQGNRAGNCHSTTDGHGCPKLDWTWETCGDNDVCTADMQSHHAACVPVCDPPAECHSGCANGVATTCHVGTGDNGCGTATGEQIPCGGMTCVADPVTSSATCVDACAAEDATMGTQACDRAWGYRWDGVKCSYLGGWCPCTGKDCEVLHGTQETCMAAHAICGAGTTDKTRCESSQGTWSDASGCDCGPGGGWDAGYGCGPKSQLLCAATGGTFAPAYCGPYCGDCACPDGTSWSENTGCR